MATTDPPDTHDAFIQSQLKASGLRVEEVIARKKSHDAPKLERFAERCKRRVTDKVGQEARIKKTIDERTQTLVQRFWKERETIDASVHGLGKRKEALWCTTKPLSEERDALERAAEDYRWRVWCETKLQSMDEKERQRFRQRVGESERRWVWDMNERQAGWGDAEDKGMRLVAGETMVSPIVVD
jgi:hypothetical protein